MTSPRLTSTLVISVLSVLAFSRMALAQDNSPIELVLEPHCADEDRTHCPVFDVLNPAHLATGVLQIGDILDVDVVLVNGMNTGIKTIQSWLSYDPESLEVRSVSVTPALAKPTPGEQKADPTLKIIKIGGDTGEIKTNRVSIARITFRVKETGKNNLLAFDNFREDGMGQTSIRGDSILRDKQGGLGDVPCLDAMICRKDLVSLLQTEPSALAVLVESMKKAANDLVYPPAGATQSSAAASVIPVSQPQTNSMPTGNTSSFALLQVQNVRVTSRDSSIFLGWNPLQSSALAGYNVYYGTVSGRYIQRRSVAANTSSLVIRDLEPGTMYFFAVRGYDGNDLETVFSQEVSVTVGSPESSSAPLIAEIPETETAPENLIESRGGTEVNGTTGTSDTLIVFAVLCAFIGTAFAAHRQYVR